MDSALYKKVEEARSKFRDFYEDFSIVMAILWDIGIVGYGKIEE